MQFIWTSSTKISWLPEGFSSHLLFHTVSYFYFSPLSTLLSFGLGKVGACKTCLTYYLVLSPGATGLVFYFSFVKLHDAVPVLHCFLYLCLFLYVYMLYVYLCLFLFFPYSCVLHCMTLFVCYILVIIVITYIRLVIYCVL